MHTLQIGGINNLSKWDEQIVDDFYEEQAIDETTSFDKIKSHFHDDFHKSLFCNSRVRSVGRRDRHRVGILSNNIMQSKFKYDHEPIFVQWSMNHQHGANLTKHI